MAAGDRKAATAMIYRHERALCTATWLARASVKLQTATGDAEDAAAGELLDPYYGYPPLLYRLNTDLSQLNRNLSQVAKRAGLQPNHLSRIHLGDAHFIPKDSILALAGTIAAIRGKDSKRCVAEYAALYDAHKQQRSDGPQFPRSQEWDVSEPVRGLGELTLTVEPVGGTVELALRALRKRIDHLERGSREERVAQRVVRGHQRTIEDYYDQLRLALDIRQEDADAIQRAVEPQRGIYEFTRDLEWRVHGNLGMAAVAAATGLSEREVSRTLRGLTPLEPDFVAAVAKMLANTGRAKPHSQEYFTKLMGRYAECQSETIMQRRTRNRRIL